MTAAIPTQRRSVLAVRRDAAVELPNARVMYDAFFARIGYQSYIREDGSMSVEFRPAREVFAESTRRSMANCPSTLLHPSELFGTRFDGRYEVRGVSGDKVVEHTDHIHLAGTLIVWCDEWNALIESGECEELSNGYTIDPGPGGIGPDGKRFDVLHTNIISDHHAGVPKGNAGTARVLKDAAGELATRRALADIAAARMDARPLYFDLGSSWPERQQPTEKPKMDTTVLAAALSKLGPNPTPRAVLDAFVSFSGDSQDPAIIAMCKAIGAMPPGESEDGGMGEMMDAAPEREAKLDARERTLDEREARIDALAIERADLLALARRALGDTWQPRLDDGAPKLSDAIKREIVGKIDAKRLTKIDAKPEAQRPAAIDFHLDECREILDSRRDHVDALIGKIAETRQSGASEHASIDERLDAVSARHGGQQPRST